MLRFLYRLLSWGACFNSATRGPDPLERNIGRRAMTDRILSRVIEWIEMHH